MSFGQPTCVHLLAPTQPIDVWRNPKTGRLEIQDGHHRTIAALELKLDKVSIRVWGENEK
uniref:ParB N-terminal domain-containing protein n=1 Tax=Obesumbacterium proteus TaxID=82983 RepID=UPI00398C5262